MIKLNFKAKIAIALIAIAGCAFGGYKYYESQQSAKQAAAVQTVAVTRMNMKSTVSATGTIKPVDSVEISSKVTARIKEIPVHENDEVKAGQTVCLLDGSDLEAQRDQASYQVTHTRAAYNRVSYLYSIGADTQQQLEDAQYEYDTAVSKLSEAQTDMNETVITSPMDGIVVGEPKTVGTMARTGDNPTVIMRIADLSAKQIQAKIDETDIGNVKVGQEATFTVDAYTDKKFTARVTKISKTDTGNTWDTTDSSSSSSSSSSASVIYYYVTLDVDDPDNVLLPAMTARVEINTADKSDVLALPISTLKTDANGSYVMVKNADGSQERRAVETGIYSDEYVEIVSGLDEGEEVVSSYTATKTTSSKNSNRNGGGPGGPPM